MAGALRGPKRLIALKLALEGEDDRYDCARLLIERGAM